jgi:hypothetical protein
MTSTPQPAPTWAPRRWVLEKFQIPVRQLDRAAAEGLIRTVKFGERAQSARLFKTSDIEAWLDALSAGRTPRRIGGRAHKQ